MVRFNVMSCMIHEQILAPLDMAPSLALTKKKLAGGNFGNWTVY